MSRVRVFVPALLIEDGVIGPPEPGAAFKARLRLVQNAYWNSLSEVLTGVVQPLTASPWANRQDSGMGGIGSETRSSARLKIRETFVVAWEAPRPTAGILTTTGLLQASYDADTGSDLPFTRGQVRGVALVVAVTHDGDVVAKYEPQLRVLERSPRWFNRPYVPIEQLPADSGEVVWEPDRASATTEERELGVLATIELVDDM